MSQGIRARKVGDIYLTEQPNINGWIVSYNSDDGRFYVTYPEDDQNSGGIAKATFAGNSKGWSNLVYWCKKNPLKESN